MFATFSIPIVFHSRVIPAIHRLPAFALWLLFTSTLCPELSGGLAWAAITGVGLAAPSTPLQIQRGTLGTIQPIRTVERTNRDCDLNALPRIMDDTYCDKYYVCSDGKYVGLFCPVGMAFDYGLQECHLKQRVDCSKRPLFFADGLVSGTGETTPAPPTTTHAVPARMTLPPITSTTIPPPGQTAGSTVILPFGGTVSIPFGSTIFLPPGSQIQMQQQQPSPLAPGHSHHHHEHRSGSAASDAVGAMNNPGNTESRSADSNTDFDYYFDDDGMVDAAATTAPVDGE